ncbi:MAG: hypothetical protein ACNYWM_12690 [Methanosarcinales archaeon]
MLEKEKIIIDLLMAERETCYDAINTKLNDIIKLNSIFLSAILIGLVYASEINIEIIFIAIPLLIFGWIWYIYSDGHYFWVNSKLISLIENEINAIIGKTVMRRENFMREFHKNHLRYNIFVQIVLVFPMLIIYIYCIHRFALISEKYYSSTYFVIFLLGIIGIFFILFSIYYIYSNLNKNDKLLEDFEII